MASLGIPACGYWLSATISACSAKSIRDGPAAGISRGLAVGRQPVGVSAVRAEVVSVLVRRPASSRSPSVAAARPGRCGTRTKRSRRSPYDTPVVGWRGRARPARCGCGIGARGRPATARCVHRRRLSRRPRRAGAGRVNCRRCSIPATARRRGSELRLRQEYFFVSRLAAEGHRPAAISRSYSELAALAGQDSNPAQRHPSVASRTIAEADAAARRCLQHAVGRGLARDGRHVLLHQPHAVARGAGNLVGRAVRAGSAAPSRYHLPDQRRASRCRARIRPVRHGRSGGDVADR